MAKYRARLPQLDGGVFLTDGGLETTLVFLDGIDLPHFAAFHLLRDEGGRRVLRGYYEQYAATARTMKAGFVLEAPTWRANADWGARLGYSPSELAAMNEAAIGLMEDVRSAFEEAAAPMVISGCVGPRGDGYDPGRVMTADEAEEYHSGQIGVFARTAADMVTAVTMTNVNEAIGVVRAASRAAMPVAISFTVETDGRLPSGDGLGKAIEAVDAATGAAPAYYMINCAHPTHFGPVLEDGGAWVQRLRGIRANASRRSHAELDNSTDLDDGDPVELGQQYRDLLRRFPHISVLGGCCGTDHRHIAAIGKSCLGG